MSIVLIFALSCNNKASVEKPIESKGPYLAKINGVEINEQDIKEEFELLPPEIQQLYATEDGMESLLDELVKKEILYQEGKKRGYQQVDEFKEQVDEFKRRLTIAHLLSDEVEEKVSVSDKEIRDFYDSNRDKFVREVPGKEEPEVIEFEMVENLIRDRLVAENQKEVFDSYVESLREKAVVELNIDALKSAFANNTAP
jgi:peptidyl-prolyl cis-trans isomerase C